MTTSFPKAWELFFLDFLFEEERVDFGVLERRDVWL